jgi:hypothetical protein
MPELPACAEGLKRSRGQEKQLRSVGGVLLIIRGNYWGAAGDVPSEIEIGDDLRRIIRSFVVTSFYGRVKSHDTFEL